MIIPDNFTSAPPANITSSVGCIDAPVFLTQLTYLWVIGNEKISSTLNSPKFSNDSEVECYMSLDYTRPPTTTTKRYYDYDSYRHIYSTPEPGSFKLKLFFNPTLNSSDSIVSIKTTIMSKKSGEKIVPDKKLMSGDNLSQVSLATFLSDKINIGEGLTVSCEIKVINPTSKETNMKTSTYCHLYEDLNKLADDKTYTDVTLHVGDEDIRAHKAILAARSSVFANIFEQKMNESSISEVNITGIEPAVVQEMLRFVYTGKSPKLKQMAEKLLIAADKYNIDELKKACEQEMVKKGVTVDTAVNTLIAADKYDVQELKALAINFINKHSAEIMQKADWKGLVESHPDLLEEAYRALAAISAACA